jgi:hypothetical protein
MYDTVEKFREFLSDTDYINNGVQHKYAFPNGYGASVVKHDFSYGGKNGLWELAVLNEGELDFSTVITHDVIGHLSWKEVEKVLENIKNL